MQRNVSAIVDIGAPQGRGPRHRGENLLGDRAGHRGHRGHEAMRAERRNGGGHAPGDDALGPRGSRRRGRAQQRQFRAELVEDGHETARGACIGRLDRVAFAGSIDDQIDRPVVEMSAPIRQGADLRRLSHDARFAWPARATTPSMNTLVDRSAWPATTSLKDLTSST